MTATAFDCQEEGCTESGLECWLPDDEGQGSFVYCGTHAFPNGFCTACGQFWGGIESFEFLHPGLCDNCHSEMENEMADEDDPDDGDYDSGEYYDAAADY